MDGKAAAWQSEHPATPGPPAHLMRQSRAAWYFARMAGGEVRYDHGRGRWSVPDWAPLAARRGRAVERLWLTVLATRYREALATPTTATRPALGEVQAAGATNAAIRAGLRSRRHGTASPPRRTRGTRTRGCSGCENGVVNLRTGELRAGRPEEMDSRSTGVVYERDAPARAGTASSPRCSRGRGASPGTACSSGRRLWESRQVLPIHHGLGNNGKSVAMGAQQTRVGDYAVATPVETLVSATRAAGEATPDRWCCAVRGSRSPASRTRRRSCAAES